MNDGPDPTARDIWRGIEQADPEPGELDRTKVWSAFVSGTSPREMDSEKEAMAIRKWWCVHYPRAEREEVEDMSDEAIAKFDDWIERSDPPF